MCHNRNVIAIAKAELRPTDGEPWFLEYFVRQMRGIEGELVYGLRVDKRRVDGVLLEREETPALTGSLEDATKLARVFAEGTVPPCVLLEMVDECFDLVFPPCVHATWQQYAAVGK